MFHREYLSDNVPKSASKNLENKTMNVDSTANNADATIPLQTRLNSTSLTKFYTSIINIISFHTLFCILLFVMKIGIEFEWLGIVSLLWHDL